MSRWWPCVALIALSCGKDKETTDPAPEGDADADTDSDTDADADADADTDADTDAAWARLVHTSSPIGPVDIYFDGGASVGTVPPLAASPWQRPTAGQHEIRVSAAGAPAADAFATFPQELLANGRYTVVVHGTSLLDAAGEMYVEDVSGLAPGNLRFAFMNGVSGTHVDVIETSTSTLATAGGVPYPTRTVFPDLPDAAYTFGIDWDRDGAWECSFVIGSPGAGTLAALYLVTDGVETKVLAQNSAGASAMVDPFEGTCPRPDEPATETGGTGAGTLPTGGSGSTADTGP